MTEVSEPEQTPGSGGENFADGEIRRVLHQQDGALRRCYEALLLRLPAVPSGSLTVRIHITPAGVVEQAEVVNGTIEDAEFRRCVEERVRTMTFPLTDGASVIEAPFGFQAGARGD